MFVVVSLLVLLAGAGGTALDFGPTLIEVPAELGVINWNLTPAAVLAEGKTGQSVVWLGTIEKVTAKPRGEETEVEWLCRHLRFAEPGPAAIARRPIPVTRDANGLFVVDLIIKAPTEAAETIQEHFAGAGQYLLVAGRVEDVVTRDGSSAVVLHAARMLQANELIENVNH